MKKVFRYDWKDEAGYVIDDLIDLPQGEKYYFYGADTDSDEFALVVSNEPMTGDEVNDAYIKSLDEDE